MVRNDEERRLLRLSKYLSKHLRHRPERLGLELGPGGWVEVDALLEACARQRFTISRAELEEVVERNDKKRFAFDPSGTQHNNIEQVRLFHDSFNLTSLSLYASMGFDTKDSVALMQATLAAEADNNVRLITEPDLPAIEDLSKRIYKNSRRNDVAAAAPYGFAAFLRERQGRVTGYLLPGNFGHGVAETEEDALALVGEAARRLPPEFARFFCPLSEGSFYRKALQAGYRTIKVMNYMALGPYEHPDEVWMPSVLY